MCRIPTLWQMQQSSGGAGHRSYLTLRYNVGFLVFLSPLHRVIEVLTPENECDSNYDKILLNIGN